MLKSNTDKKGYFYLQATDISKEGPHRETVVSFEWNIIYSCNFRCPHCIFDGKWDEYGKRTVFIGRDEWIKYWTDIYKHYGRTTLIVTGGEPFIYPDFIGIIKAISSIHYPINISSNGSGDIDGFIKNIDPGRVSVNLSFQPGFNELEDIIAKKKLLDNAGFNTTFINLCAYPPYLDSIETYTKKANNMGEVLKIIPFYGVYNGRKYPDSYSEKEKLLLGIDSVWEKNVRRKGMACKAGYTSALIFPDGKVARCGQIGERFPLGNIFKGDFKLLESPMLCDVDLCPCLEGEIAE